MRIEDGVNECEDDEEEGEEVIYKLQLTNKRNGLYGRL